MRTNAKLLLAFAALAASTQSWSRGTTWYVLNKEIGCVALGEADDAFPYLKAGANPPQLLKLFRKRYADATMQPFVSAAAQSHKSERSVETPEEREAYKGLTLENAFVISSVRSEEEIALFTEEACVGLGWLSDRSSSR